MGPERADRRVDARATAPVVATVLLAALVAALAVAVVWLAPSPPAVDLPEAVLDGRLREGWIVVRHRGGEPFSGQIRTVVDGVPAWTGPVEMVPGATVNASRPARNASWAVRVEVHVDDHRIHAERLRDGTRDRSGPDLVPEVSVSPGRVEMTVRNLGASPTPEGKQTLVYLYVDGEDPSDQLGWASNRNHTPDPVPPGGGFTRVRRYDPSDLGPGPHTFEVVANVNRDGEPNIAETRYDNNRDATTR